MIDQFEAEKCLNTASTDNLVLTILDNRPNHWATPGNSDGPNPRTRVESGAKPLGSPAGAGAWN